MSEHKYGNYKYRMSLSWRCNDGFSERSQKEAKKIDRFLDNYSGNLLDTDLEELHSDLNELFSHIERVSNKYDEKYDMRKSENIFYRVISGFLTKGYVPIANALQGVEEVQKITSKSANNKSLKEMRFDYA